MKGQKPDYAWLAARLESLRVIQPDGTPGFQSTLGGHPYLDIRNILETYEDFDSDVSEIQRSRLVRDAIQAAAKHGNITAESLLRELSRQKTLYAKKPKTEFTLATSLSVKRPGDLHRVTFDGASFIFSDTLPARFSRKHWKIQETWNPPHDLPPDFTKVRVTVQSRADFDAYETAIDSLDYLRGIWNFAINCTISWRYHAGPVKPINSIYLGPVHTLHLRTGKPASETYWYEAVYPPWVEAKPVKKWHTIKHETSRIRSIIIRHPYSDFLRQTFIRYARSLDRSDYESSFLKFWSLLEWVTAISVEQNYGEVIKRVLFLFEDEDFHRRILEHLRIRRNGSIHGGKSLASAFTLIYQIKVYVEWIIMSHLRTTGHFKTPQEFGQMLSSPADPNALTDKLDQLSAQIRLLRAAQKIKTRKEKTEQRSGDNHGSPDDGLLSPSTVPNTLKST